MKIQFTPKDFLPSLRLAFTATAAKNCSPVLRNVKIVTRHGCAELHAATEDTKFIKYVNAIIEDNGAILVPKDAVKIIDSMPKDLSVTLESTKDGIVFYGENTPRYELLTDDVKDFPKIKSYSAESKETELTLHVDDMLMLINRTMPCMQKENARYALGGVCFETTKAGKTLEAVATNGHQLSWCTCGYVSDKKQKFTTGRNNNVIIPYNTISLLAAVLKDKDGSARVKMAQVGNKVRFEYGCTILVIDPLNGTFPTWRKIIDSIKKSGAPKLRAVIQSDDLITALKNIKPLLDKNAPSVVLNFFKERLVAEVRVKEKNQDKVVTSSSLPIKCNGNGIIEINPKSLMDVLKYVGGELHWTMDGDEPAMFTAGDNYHYVTMGNLDGKYDVEVDGVKSKKKKSE